MSKFKKLSRVEMKNVIGGQQYFDCKVTTNSDCGGGSSFYGCSGTAGQCQALADGYCSQSDCCDDIDCR